MEYTELKPLPAADPAPAPRPANPTNQDLLAALLEIDGDAARLIREFGLSPRRYLAFAQDPEVVETLAAFDAMQERHHRIVAQKRQSQAAEFLHLALLDTMSPVETRRAATALARLATQMLAPPRRVPPPSLLATPEPAHVGSMPEARLDAGALAARTPTSARTRRAAVPPRGPLPDRPATPSAA